MIAPASVTSPVNRVRLFGIDLDPLTRHQAARVVLDWAMAPDRRCRFVVTPNVDHVVQLHEGGPLRAAYEDAALITADGMPVVLAARLLGKPLPERVTGADLLPDLLDAAAAAGESLRVYLFGAGPGVAERAAMRIKSRWPNVTIVGTACPPLGFERDAAEDARHIEAINAAAPDVLAIGLGAPKQELWVHRHQQDLNVKVALCIGATIDFLAGEKPRAPVWMRRSGLEWLHRLGSEPRRLFRRYAKDATVFPGLVWREWRKTGLRIEDRPERGASAP